MTSIFIFYDDLEYLSLLLNQILKKTSDIKILGFNQTITKDSIKTCNKIMPNIIISSSSTNKKLKKHLTFQYISINIEKNNKKNIQIICHQLKMLSSDTKYSHKLNIINLRKKIYKELIDLRFNPNMIGTYYLLDCILCSYENPYSQLTHLEIIKYYKKIALKYETDYQAVNWNIQKSIENMYKNTSKEFRKTHYKTEEYLGYSSLINYFRFLH